jgi:hypothetical protein
VGWELPAVPEAGGVAGLLEAEAEVDEVDEDLHVALGLHGAAHDAEADARARRPS